MPPARTGWHLDEQIIQDSFHSYLRSSLAQAKAERLLDPEVLSSAQGDLMITGPALCLYFAALRSTTNPPSVPLPRAGKNAPPMDLSFENCPPVFAHFLRVWAEAVYKIQDLPPEYQHDLARSICGLKPIAQPAHPSINGIAADLRAVAIEISQRRSFQDRYASDLQAALDAGGVSQHRKVSFVPPPMYEESPHSSTPSPTPFPRLSFNSSRPRSSSPASPASPIRNHNKDLPPPPSPSLLSPTYSPCGKFPKRSDHPTILTPDSPAIEFIRETLYAGIGDALERRPSLRRLLKRDPPRAYFASVAFALLEVATTAVTTDGTAIVGVLGTPLRLEDCPVELRPFMEEVIAISAQAREIEGIDNKMAVEYAQRGDDIPDAVFDRVKIIFEHGVGHERERGRKEGRLSVEGRAVMFANRINALSLAMTKLRAFKERQEEVFKILAGIGS
ncbi:hypothetical protein APHAL10511_004254 [Amanita phalloides]|nr:hypothetical protein APHAL10511_004254 [Amanita phalloides]